MTAAFESVARQIVDQVRDWPVDARRELAEDILSTLPANSEPHQRSLKDLLGLIDTGGHPPTDEECRAIIEEERLRKYAR